jgi:hypothetical protein
MKKTLTLLLACTANIVAGGCEHPAGTSDFSCTARTQGELQAFASQADVECVIEITSSDLTTLDGLAGLRTVGGFILHDNRQLTDVAALSALEPFRVFSVDSTPLAETTDVSRVEGDLYVSTSSVRVLTGNQERVAVFNVSENAALVTLQFEALVQADSLVVEDNPALESLSFPALTSVGQFSVRNSPQITSAEIEALGAQANVPPNAIAHCGNADDSPCPVVESLD